MTLTVAHFGEEGAYASEAAAKLYPTATLVPYHSVADVMRAVTRREADYGVLPIENSLAGVVPETYDVLAHAPLAIVDEAVLPVPHVLVGLPQTNIDALTRIHSHPMALSQCRRFLSSLPDTLPEVAPSTAAAARRVAEQNDPRQAAISSRGVAQRHGLSVLLNDVSDHAQNYTRFVTVAPHTRIDRDGRDWRTAIRFVTHHHPGALHDAIEPLRRYGREHDVAPVPSDPGPALELPVLRRRRGAPARPAGVRCAPGDARGGRRAFVPRVLPGLAA